MKKVLKYTYLLKPEKVDKELEKLWSRYQKILDKPSWESLNEARAILFLIGDVYLEKIASEAIERRLHLLKAPLKPLEFYSLIDKKRVTSAQLKDPVFKELSNFYKIVKKHKNRFVGGKFYLDEERFLKLYNKYNPLKISESLSIKERGKF